MKACLLVGLALLAASVGAAPRVVATIDDPAGDDVGNGSLILPQRSDFQPGDLDLVRLQISRDDEGTWFEASLKNPIRDPAHAFSAVGGEPLSNIARKGFYQFNLDVYIDTDRVSGSGNTFTLPGRKASIAPAYAWEKAVILTPRPEAMRSRLIEVLERQFPDRPKGEAAASVDASMFFPTRVRVRGKSVVFLVPAGFTGESDAKTWAITAFVTGARTDIGLNLSLLPAAKNPLEELDLGVMQPVVGQPRDTFGFTGGAAPSPIVDLLAPAAGRQVQLLSGGVALVGVALGAGESAPHVDAPLPSPEPATPTGPSWGDAPAARPAAPRAAAAPPATPPSTPPPLKDLLQPGKPAGTGEPPAGAPPSIASRLQMLQQLLDQKLITEAEFKQQRQRILNEL